MSEYPVHHLPRRTLRRASRGGFTLIEASLATIIIGVGFVAVLQLLAAGSVANMGAMELTTGANLARNVNEMLMQKKYADLPSYGGKKYSPPKDSRGEDLDDYSGWEQSVAVTAVNPERLTQTEVNSSPKAVRVTVAVSHNNATVCEVSWFVFDGKP
jgi:Tfp pilus assembly protein PilV